MMISCPESWMIRFRTDGIAVALTDSARRLLQWVGANSFPGTLTTDVL